MARNTRTGTAAWVAAEKRWRIKVTRDGERKSFSSSTPKRKGQREANEKADKWLEYGTHNETTKIAKVWEDYLASLLNMEMLPADYLEHLIYYRKHFYSFNQHEGLGRLWILPQIGHKRLCSLTEHDLQVILNNAKAKDLAKKSVKNIQAAQNAFLIYCRRKRYTSFRPEDVRLPGGLRTKKKSIINSYEDVNKLFTSDMTSMREAEAFECLIWGFRFDFVMGLRPGELNGLQWPDIKDNRLTINRSITSRGIVTQGKNENANKEIVIPEIGMFILEQQRKINPPQDNLFVFEHYTQGTYLNRWHRYCAHNDIPKCTLKEMRHTCVSWLKNLPDNILKNHIRHSYDMPTISIYGQELIDDVEQRAVAVNNMFLKMLPFLEDKCPFEKP